MFNIFTQPLNWLTSASKRLEKTASEPSSIQLFSSTHILLLGGLQLAA
jgi:hypothetical protein